MIRFLPAPALLLLLLLNTVTTSAQYNERVFLDRSGKVTDSVHASYYRVPAEVPGEYRICYYPGKQLYFEGRILKTDDTDEGRNIYSGNCTWYYINGKKKAERHFTSAGIEDGSSRYYFESGKLWKEYTFQDGKLKDNHFSELDETGNITDIYKEDFDNNDSGWDLSSYTGSTAGITNGRLVIESLAKEGTSRYISHPLSGAFMIEASIDAKDAHGRKYGMIWGFKDWDNYNFLMVSGSFISIGSFFEGVRFDNLSQVYCSSFEKNGLNTFKLLNDDDRLIISVNGELVSKISGLRLAGSNVGFVTGYAGKLEIDKLLVKEFTGKNSSYLAGNDLDIKSSGTGFILSASGYIATNSHVTENASFITVDLPQDGKTRSYDAKVVSRDEANDLCILKVEPAQGFPSAIEYAFATSTLIAPGASVFTLGYPLALSGMGLEAKFTDGKISSKTGYNNAINSFQTTIPVQPGNSGSPVFNDKGELIGIINAKVMAADNVSYAVKLSYLRNLYEILTDPVIPASTSVESLPLTDKISLLSKYVVLIKIK